MNPPRLLLGSVLGLAFALVGATVGAGTDPLATGGAARPAGAPRARTLEVTALANAGFLLRADGRSVLLDAFVAEPHSLYDALPASLLAALESARPPFDDVVLALVSHAHADHLQAAPARAFLAHSPACRLWGPPQACEQVLDGAADPSLAERVSAIWPEVGGQEVQEFAGVQVESLRLSHGSGRFADVQSLGHLVTLDGFRVLHVGDADMDPGLFAPFDLSAREIDVALLPYWYWMSATGRRVIDECIGARQLVACHVPAQDWKDVEAFLADRYPEVKLAPAPLCSWHFEGSPAEDSEGSDAPRSTQTADAATATGADQPQQLDLSLRLETAPDLLVEVSTGFVGSASGETLFGVSETWAGVPAERTDLRDVSVSTAGGRRLEPVPAGPHRWRVAHAPGAPLVVTAHVAPNRLRGDLGSQDRYRPILEPGLFHAIGHLVLPLPEQQDDDAPLRLSLRMTGFERAGWEAFSSYGAGERRHELDTTLADLRQSLFVAGRLQVHRRAVLGGTLTVTLDDHDWPFDGARFADLAARIIDLERRFLGDSDAGDYWVDAIAVGRPSAEGLSFGGTGLTGAFALFLQPDTEIALDSRGGLPIRKLLAHECFHEWNGRRLRLAEPEEPLYWFSEGFTDHFARTILREAGWLDEQAYVDSVNELLREYTTSPQRNLPAAALGELFWSDRVAQRQPYLRGDLAAFLLDHGMRRASGGTRGLADLMRELLDRARAGAGNLDAETLLTSFARHAGPELAATLAAIVVDGETVRVPPDLLGPGWRLTETTVDTWDPGFDLDASLEAGRVLGLRPGSPAERAGLVEGRALLGWSVHRGDPARDIELQVQAPGEVLTVRYRPVGAPVAVPRFESRE